MRGIGAHPDRATLSPRSLTAAAHAKRSAQGHEQLDAMMAVRGGCEAWAAHDNCRGPRYRAATRTEPHARILASRGAACKVGCGEDDMKTHPNVNLAG